MACDRCFSEKEVLFFQGWFEDNPHPALQGAKLDVQYKLGEYKDINLCHECVTALEELLSAWFTEGRKEYRHKRRR